MSALIQIYPHAPPREAAAPSAFTPGQPEITWPALAAFWGGGGVKEAKRRQGNKGDGEVCRSAGLGPKQLTGRVEL